MKKILEMECSMKKILLIDTSDIGAAYSAEAIKKLGFEPVFLVDFNDFQGDTARQIRQYQHYQVDTKSLEALVRLIQENALGPIEAIISALDSRIPIALALAERLEVRGMCRALDKVIDKNNVCHLIPEYSPANISFSVDALPIEKIKQFLKRSKSCFLKPIRAAGGVGGKCFSSETSVSFLLEHIQKFPHVEWMLMDYIDGRLISLEGFVEANKVHFLGFTSRRKVGNTESYMGFPHDKMISHSLQIHAKQAVSTLIERSGYTHGYFHTEFMVTSECAYLIDANFGRLGGGALLEIIAYAYDISPIDIMSHVFALTLYPENLAVSPYSEQPKREGAAINYSLPVSRKIVRIEEKIVRKVHHTILLNQGTTAPAAGESNWSWVGFLSGSESDVLSEIKNITILTNDGSFTPCF